MGDHCEAENLELQKALLHEMAHILEVLESLLGVLQQAELSAEQKSVVEDWKRSLPELRHGFNVLAGGNNPPSKSASSSE